MKTVTYILSGIFTHHCKSACTSRLMRRRVCSLSQEICAGKQKSQKDMTLEGVDPIAYLQTFAKLHCQKYTQESLPYHNTYELLMIVQLHQAKGQKIPVRITLSLQTIISISRAVLILQEPPNLDPGFGC